MAIALCLEGNKQVPFCNVLVSIETPLATQSHVELPFVAKSASLRVHSPTSTRSSAAMQHLPVLHRERQYIITNDLPRFMAFARDQKPISRLEHIDRP